MANWNLHWLYSLIFSFGSDLGKKDMVAISLQGDQVESR
jgi:hypothetical protein